MFVVNIKENEFTKFWIITITGIKHGHFRRFILNKSMNSIRFELSYCDDILLYFNDRNNVSAVYSITLGSVLSLIMKGILLTNLMVSTVAFLLHSLTNHLNTS